MAAEGKSLESDKKFMDLYSRQIGAFGMETMAKLVTMRVLIVGVKGVGVEIAKNLALAGPGSITLMDNDEVALRHLGANFFLREDDVGSKIAACVAPRVQELNKGVKITVGEELNEDLVKAHDIVVFTQGTREDLTRWNSFCRTQKLTVTDDRGASKDVAKPIAFISCQNYGLAGAVFSDFGPDFTIRDANGEAVVTRVITNITCEKEGIVTLLPEHEGGRLHGVEDTDHEGFIEISEVKGMFAKDEAAHERVGLSINDSGSWRARTATKKVNRKGKEVEVFDGYKLKIGDTSQFSPYMGGGVLTQVKKPITKNYRSYAESVVQPVTPGDWGLLFTDGAKFGRGEQLHFAFQAVADFQADHDGALPRVGNEEDAADVVARAKALNDGCKAVNRMAAGSALALDELDEDTIKNVAMFAAVEVQPVACFFGGLVAQEIVKLTGKFTPLNQWLHLDFFEALPAERPADAEPIGSRYDDHISIWGKAFQDKVANARTFMVGCGALGCELLKNFALMGFATGPDGLITTTDNDRIEVSNLNRQFLFRDHNVGQAKSVASRVAAIEMNSDINIKAMEILVEPKTETTFNDEFWNSLMFVTNALDNIKARQYVDSRCVFFGKALLESGTLGTKCNSLPIVPHITQSYTDGPQSGDNEDEIPMCTLRNFPSLIDHCIEWARAQFTDGFVEPVTGTMKFISDPAAFLEEVEGEVTGAPDSKKAVKIASALSTVRDVKKMVDAADGATFDVCIKLALDMFYGMFRDRIKNLTIAFPEDATKSDGSPFWSGAKRFPTAAEFDPTDDAHMTFVISTANILAVNLGVVPPPPFFVPEDDEKRSPEYFSKVIASLPVPEFKPTKTDDVDADGEEKKDKEVKSSEEDEKELKDLLAGLRARNVSRLQVEPADFEKDQDANFHIDFIYSASNLRAANYSIKQASRHKCKMIAGKIIPAIATTTASVTGLVMIEMLKILQDKPLEAYKTSSNNLGTNAYLFSEPLPPAKAKKEYSDIAMCEVRPVPDGFTKWDKTEINKGDLTVREFMAAFKEQTELEITSLFHPIAARANVPQTGKWIVPGVKDADMDKSMKDYCVELYGDEILAEGVSYFPFEVETEDEEGDECIVPQVIYKWA